MIKHIEIRTFIAFLCALLLGSNASGQDYSTITGNSVANIDTMLGAYGYNGELEPKIPQEEIIVFQELKAAMAISPATGLSFIEPYMTSSSSAVLFFMQGILQAQQGLMDKSIKNLKITIAKHPNFLQAHKKLGIALATTGEFEEAIPYLSKTINLGNPDSITYGLLGLCFLNKEQNISAEAAYSQAIIFAPTNMDWKKGLARAFLEQQKFNEGISIIEEILKGKPEDAILLTAQANAYIGKNQPGKAGANFEIIDRMGKSTPLTLMLLGDIYVESEVTDLALKAYLDALKKESTLNIPTALRTANILASRGAIDEAAIYITKINQFVGDDLEDSDKLGLLKLESRIALGRGDQERAMVILEEIIDYDPLDGEALIMLARSYKGKQEYAKATMFFERAQKVDKYEVDALIEEAKMLVAQRKFVAAVPLLQRAQNRRPSDRVARYLQAVRLIRDSQRL
ncbi:MAG: tetratricopeptide repeat protein [Opitutaceae bacterium]|nr:tetratricopeptide repeat protein [Opitutaceae bacterium]